MTSPRNDKLTGLPHLRLTVNEQHLFSTAQNVWEIAHSESSQAVKTDLSSLQTDRTADHRHHQNEGYQKQSAYIQSRHVDNLATGSQMEARKVSPVTLLLPKHVTSLGLPGSLALDSTRKGLTADTPTPSSLLKAHINSVHTKSTCHPKSNIFFLKTHKTASSTILNILYRYGESRNLTFALPLNKHSQLFYPFFFASHFVEGVSSRSVREFHIMCNHMRFTKSEVSFIRKCKSWVVEVLPCFVLYV